MNAQVKHARFNLLVCGITAVLTGSTFLLLQTIWGPTGSWASFGWCGLFGLLGIAGKFYRTKPGGPKVLMDERDVAIRERSDLAAWRVVWGYWGLLCMGPWFFFAFQLGFDTPWTISIPVYLLPLGYGAATIVYVVSWSIAVLAQYGSTSNEDAVE